MKYQMMQLINKIKDAVTELDESTITNPLLDEIYRLTNKMEELLDDHSDSFDNNSSDWDDD